MCRSRAVSSPYNESHVRAAFPRFFRTHADHLPTFLMLRQVTSGGLTHSPELHRDDSAPHRGLRPPGHLRRPRRQTPPLEAALDQTATRYGHGIAEPRRRALWPGEPPRPQRCFDTGGPRWDVGGDPRAAEVGVCPACTPRSARGGAEDALLAVLADQLRSPGRDRPRRAAAAGRGRGGRRRVEDVKEGRVQTVLSGRSLIALLLKLWDIRHTTTPLEADWALATTAYNRIAAELTRVD